MNQDRTPVMTDQIGQIGEPINSDRNIFPLRDYIEAAIKETGRGYKEVRDNLTKLNYSEIRRMTSFIVEMPSADVRRKGLLGMLGLKETVVSPEAFSELVKSINKKLASEKRLNCLNDNNPRYENNTYAHYEALSPKNQQRDWGYFDAVDVFGVKKL
jgi:hypothetical protein